MIGQSRLAVDVAVGECPECPAPAPGLLCTDVGDMWRWVTVAVISGGRATVSHSRRVARSIGGQS